jgi:glycosyltransferase involved in cell wall biosynthesis
MIGSWYLFAGKAILGALTVNEFIERAMNRPIVETFAPIDTISIVVPSFNEEQFIENTLKSINSQSIINDFPEYFETILVDSGSTDDTVALAEPYVDKIITTDIRGKLTARNLAMKYVSGNIVVSVDSDTYYPPYWLNTLLEPFNNINGPNYNSDIIAVVGSTYDAGIPFMPTQIRNIVEMFDRNIIHPTQMVGRNSAFTKMSFYLSGNFDESVNQMDVDEMVREEEQEFGLRLSKLGKIVFKMNANCIHLGGEKIGCRIGTANKDYCSSKGISIERFG